MPISYTTAKTVECCMSRIMTHL